MGIPERSTPRSSGRLREKAQRKFEMPTRDQILGAIQTTPGKSYEQYKPRKLINNFVKERNSYNNRDDPMAMTDDEEGFSDFIVEDEPSSFESKAKKKRNNKKKGKKRRQIQQSTGSSSEGLSDFIVDDEPSPVRKMRNKKARKQTKKMEWASESESDDKEVTSDYIEEDEESGIQQSTKKTTKTMKRILSSSDSDSEKSDKITPSRRSRRISRQPKREFQKPNKKKAWENILEREPNLHQTVENDDVTDFVVGDEEVEEGASDLEIDLEEKVEAGEDICEKSSTDEVVAAESKISWNDSEDQGEADLPENLGDNLNKTDEELSREQENNDKEIEVGSKNLLVSRKTEVTEAEGSSDGCESDLDCRTVGRNLRSKIHRKRQLSKALDSDGSESEDEKINDTFVERKKRRTPKCLNSDDDDSGDNCGGEQKEDNMAEV